jgi:hypothetical protein
MTESFTDTAGRALSFVPFEVDEGETTPVFVARVPCHAGRTLAARPDAGLTVEARPTASGDPFVDIAATPYDLTPFDGLTVSFDFRLTAGAVAALSPLEAVIRLAYA